MAITAADVKKLRDATGAGMMDAKRALTEAEGDFDKAIELLRISGLAKAAKRADREATNGIVAGRDGALIQFASETDFVAKNGEFVGLADDILAAVIASGAKDVAATNEASLASGAKVADAVAELGAKIGENLSVHDVAMHVAAFSPTVLSREDVPADVVENERRIAEATAKEEGKPEGAIPRIVEGRVGGFFKDVVLVDQAAVWEDKKSVGDALKAGNTSIVRFVRFAVGA